MANERERALKLTEYEILYYEKRYHSTHYDKRHA